MMLKPEQLRNMRQAANGLWKVEFDGRGIRQIVDHIDALQARIAELEQVAARYRWLRDKRQSKSENLLATLAVRHENGWSWRSAVGEELDAAIDAAMQK